MSGLPQSYGGVQFPMGGHNNAYPPSASSYSSGALPQQQQSNQQQVQVQPGSLTYTTSTLPDGRIQYNQFRAEQRSYQTPQGLVHGIQWIPVQVTYEIPSNANPAGPDFHASWSRPNDKESQKMLKEWQRDQEKRARKEEKESARRMKEWERERREREKAEEKDLRRAQERDMVREGGRTRRLSNVGGEYSQYPTASGGYGRARSRSRARMDSAGQEEITRAMAEMAMDREWAATDAESRWDRESMVSRERRNSNVGRPRKMSMNTMGVRPRSISTSEYDRPRRTSSTPFPSSVAGGYSGGYGPPSPGRGGYGPPSPGRSGFSGRGSPYLHEGGLPPASGVPVYPPGHIYAGKPIPGMQGERLGNMDGEFGPPSPRGRSRLQLESPAGFTRPPSLAVPYTYFDPLQIVADMNELYQRIPLMPAVLSPHDVWIEDWIRCLEDLANAWTGKMPVVERHRVLKNHTMVAQLLDLWNASFFSLRGVELVLYRGRQRRSGPHAGRYDTRLGLDPSSEDDSDTISSVSDESDDDRYAFYGSTHATLGGSNHWLSDSREARRAHKLEKRMREKQRRKRRERERRHERGSGFSLLLTCTSEGQPRGSTSGYPGVAQGYSSTSGY